MNDPQGNPGEGNGSEEKKQPNGKNPPVQPPTVDPTLQGIVEEVRRNERDNATNDQAEQKRQRILERTAVWQARAAVSIVLLTVAGLVINYWQSSATSDQYNAMMEANAVAKTAAEAAKQAAEAATNSNRIAEDTASKQLRATVWIDDASFKPSPTADVMVLELRIKNYGQTPAYSVIPDVEFAYLKPPFEFTDPGYRHATPHSMVILGAGGSFTQKWRTTITASEVRKLKNGALQLQIFGSIMYSDAFNRRYTANFRIKWGGDLGTQDLTFDRFGNEETNNEEERARIEKELRTETIPGPQDPIENPVLKP
jgi:hypothetical protein